MVKQGDIISVIVPVYNSGKWVGKCIESIIAQTYKNWELLLIDDGSTDNSGAICDNYANLDPRIHVHHKENGGVSSARNLGLEKSCGKWISFVDSDDWVSKDYLESLYSSVNLSPDIDFAKCLFWFEYPDGTRAQWSTRAIYETPLTIQEAINTAHGLLWNIAGSIYRKEIIKTHKLSFESGFSLGEDTFFNYSFVSKSKQIAISSISAYHYRQENSESLSKRKPQQKEIFSFLKYTNKSLGAFPESIDVSKATEVLITFAIRQMLSLNPSHSLWNEFLKNEMVVKELISKKCKPWRRRVFDSLIYYGMNRVALLFARKFGPVY